MNYNETKLIVFLKTFSKEELSEFEKFISNSNFKTGRDLSPFFNVLKKYHPDFSSKDFNEENIFKQLNPNSDFTEKKSTDILRTLSSSLLKAIEEFLFQSRIRKNRLLRNRMLLSELLNRNLFKYYEPYLKTAVKDLKEDEEISGLDNLESFYLERLNTRYYANVLNFGELFKSTVHAEELISAYFFIDLFRTAKTLFLGSIKRNANDEKNIIEEIIASTDIEKIMKKYQGTLQYVFISFNYFTYKCLKNNYDNKYYESAKNVFFENRKNICRYDRIFFYADLMNVNFARNNSGNLTPDHELLHIFKCCLEDKAYKVSDNDFMHPDFYRNVINISCSLKEFTWAEYFITKYSDELNHAFRDNMRLFAMAFLYFGKKDFEKSLEFISKVKYDLADFKIDIKILMLKIYYELKLTEQAYSTMDTFRHYLKNAKGMPEEVRISYSSFLKYYSKMISPTVSKNELAVLKNELLKENKIYQKNWLNEKLEVINLSKKPNF